MSISVTVRHLGPEAGDETGADVYLAECSICSYSASSFEKETAIQDVAVHAFMLHLTS